MRTSTDSFLSQVVKIILILLLLIVLELCVSSAVQKAWAFDLNEDELFKGTAGLHWTHYDPWGSFNSNVRLDTETGSIRQFGLGHYFDRLDAGFSVTANRSINDSRYQMGYFLNKRFFNNYRLSFNYQPLNDSKTYGFSGRFFDRKLFLNVQYNDQYQTWNMRGATRLWNNVSLNSGVRTDHNGDWEVNTGLQVRFTTGTKVRRSKVKEKEIEWLN